MFNFKRKQKCLNYKDNTQCKLVYEIKELQELYRLKKEELKSYKDLNFADFNHVLKVLAHKYLKTCCFSSTMKIDLEYNFNIISEALHSLNPAEFNEFLKELTTIYNQYQKIKQIDSELSDLKFMIEDKKKQLGIE